MPCVAHSHSTIVVLVCLITSARVSITMTVDLPVYIQFVSTFISYLFACSYLNYYIFQGLNLSNWLIDKHKRAVMIPSDVNSLLLKIYQLLTVTLTQTKDTWIYIVLFFDIRILITPLVSSTSSYISMKMISLFKQQQLISTSKSQEKWGFNTWHLKPLEQEIKQIVKFR
jgi:hypothetical protein